MKQRIAISLALIVAGTCIIAPCLAPILGTTRAAVQPGDTIVADVVFGWNATCGVLNQSDAGTAIATDDTSIYVGGFANSTSMAPYITTPHFAVAKFTASGGLAWCKTWGPDSGSNMIGLIEADATGAYALAVTYYIGNSTYSRSLVKISPASVISWQIPIAPGRQIYDMKLVGTTLYTCGDVNGTMEVAKFSAVNGMLLWNATFSSGSAYHLCVLDGNHWTIGMGAGGHLEILRWTAAGMPVSVGLIETFTSSFLGGCGIWTDGEDVYAIGGVLAAHWMNGRRPIIVKYSSSGSLAWNTSLVMNGSDLRGLSGRRAGSSTQVFVVGINQTSDGEIACVGDDGVQKWVAKIPVLGGNGILGAAIITTSGEDIYICSGFADQITVVNIHVPLPGSNDRWIAIIVTCSLAAVIVIVVAVAGMRARSNRI